MCRSPNHSLVGTKLFCQLGTLVLFIFVSANCLALPSDKEQAIEILADSAERDEKNGITVYSGNVDIKQGTLHIMAEKVTIKTFRSSATGAVELEKIIAVGNPAHFQQQLEVDGDFVEADANIILYTIANRIVQLKDNAKLSQAGSIITGEQISYDIAAQRVQARGQIGNGNTGERVKVIIPSSKPDNADSPPDSHPEHSAPEEEQMSAEPQP